jgi:hypothetical protein
MNVDVWCIGAKKMRRHANLLNNVLCLCNVSSMLRKSFLSLALQVLAVAMGNPPQTCATSLYLRHEHRLRWMAGCCRVYFMRMRICGLAQLDRSAATTHNVSHSAEFRPNGYQAPLSQTHLEPFCVYTSASLGAPFAGLRCGECRRLSECRRVPSRCRLLHHK